MATMGKGSSAMPLDQLSVELQEKISQHLPTETMQHLRCTASTFRHHSNVAARIKHVTLQDDATKYPDVDSSAAAALKRFPRGLLEPSTLTISSSRPLEFFRKLKPMAATGIMQHTLRVMRSVASRQPAPIPTIPIVALSEVKCLCLDCPLTSDLVPSLASTFRKANALHLLHSTDLDAMWYATNTDGWAVKHLTIDLKHPYIPPARGASCQCGYDTCACKSLRLRGLPVAVASSHGLTSLAFNDWDSNWHVAPLVEMPNLTRLHIGSRNPASMCSVKGMSILARGAAQLQVLELSNIFAFLNMDLATDTTESMWAALRTVAFPKGSRVSIPCIAQLQLHMAPVLQSLEWSGTITSVAPSELPPHLQHLGGATHLQIATRSLANLATRGMLPHRLTIVPAASDTFTAITAGLAPLAQHLHRLTISSQPADDTSTLAWHHGCLLGATLPKLQELCLEYPVWYNTILGLLSPASLPDLRTLDVATISNFYAVHFDAVHFEVILDRPTPMCINFNCSATEAQSFVALPNDTVYRAGRMTISIGSNPDYNENYYTEATAQMRGWDELNFFRHYAYDSDHSSDEESLVDEDEDMPIAVQVAQMQGVP